MPGGRLAVLLLPLCVFSSACYLSITGAVSCEDYLSRCQDWLGGGGLFYRHGYEASLDLSDA